MHYNKTQTFPVGAQPLPDPTLSEQIHSFVPHLAPKTQSALTASKSTGYASMSIRQKYMMPL